MSSVSIINYKADYKPSFQTPQSAGCDLQSSEDVTLSPGEWKAISTGLFMEMPNNMVALVCPRSGLSLKHGVSVLNAPGVIDSDFRGEIKVILVNHSSTEYSIKKGDRIAQILFTEIHQPTFVSADKLSDTQRGSGGFGSTGK